MRALNNMRELSFKKARLLDEACGCFILTRRRCRLFCLSRMLSQSPWTIDERGATCELRIGRKEREAEEDDNHYVVAVAVVLAVVVVV